MALWLGAQRAKVTATEMDTVLALLQWNVAANYPTDGPVAVRELQWGVTDLCNFNIPEFLLLSECVYLPNTVCQCMCIVH